MVGYCFLFCLACLAAAWNRTRNVFRDFRNDQRKTFMGIVMVEAKDAGWEIEKHALVNPGKRTPIKTGR